MKVEMELEYVTKEADVQREAQEYGIEEILEGYRMQGYTVRLFGQQKNGALRFEIEKPDEYRRFVLNCSGERLWKTVSGPTPVKRSREAFVEDDAKLSGSGLLDANLNT